ncbi:MAG: hypothetical protein PVG38_13545 [Gammaproteobacteria bacterium]|jgi:hypothetical protein
MLRVLLSLLMLTLAAPIQGASRETGVSECKFPDAVRHSRPGAGQGATQIRVGVYLVDIPKIDDADQSYVADIFLRYEWRDERLASGRDTPCTVPLAAVWNPDVLVVNRRSVESLMNQVVEIQPDGRVRHLQRFYGSFALPLDLTRFPFDKQQLPVTLVARFSPEQLKLIADDELAAMAEKLSNPNWTIGAPLLSSGAYEVLPGRSIAQLEILFPAERRSAYYIWKLIVPMSFVVFMSWAAFWISPQNIAPRIGLSATSMLTLIAFRLALGSSLPPIPYLTEFDVFTIGATMLVFAALVEAVVTTALWDRERQQLAHRLNHVSKVLFPTAFAMVVVLSFSRLAIPL